MVDSVWVSGGSVVMGEQGPLVVDLELPVAPDGGGQGEQPLAAADERPTQGAATVLFQAELVFEGVDDRLDPLAQPTQRPEPARLVLAVGPDQEGAQPSGVAFELGAGQALSARMIAPAARACWRAASSSNTWATSRSPSLGWPGTR
jgi:hypothetical protein